MKNKILETICDGAKFTVSLAYAPFAFPTWGRKHTSMYEGKRIDDLDIIIPEIFVTAFVTGATLAIGEYLGIRDYLGNGLLPNFLEISPFITNTFSCLYEAERKAKE